MSFIFGYLFLAVFDDLDEVLDRIDHAAHGRRVFQGAGTANLAKAQAAQGLRLERMRASPMWTGEGFRNLHPVRPGLRDASAPRPTLSEFLCGGTRRVPAAPLPALDPREAWQRAPSSGLRATWLGHSTVLIEIDGHRVLTDPVWGTRASPFRLLGPKRFQHVPLRLRQMPEVDVVVISHDHYDHLDYPTIRALAKHSAVPVVTSLGAHAQ